MFNQTRNEESMQSSLSTVFIIVAVVPMALLLGGFVAGAYQPVLLIGALFCQIVGMVLGWKFSKELSGQSAQQHEKLQAMVQQENNFENKRDFKDEWKPIQRSVDSLVSEMQQIATGNLEVSVDVKNDLTAPVAKSVNQMTQQLRSIVGQVQSACNQVAEHSAKMRSMSEAKSQENASHTGLVRKASQQIFAMTDSFQKVADMTRESVQVAVETKQSATKGQKAVANTVDGMHRIRNQVQSTSKRIKRLGESSQEIGEIVQMISDISDRTSILALNASIQASMAGDAGQGFAVIAEEIERLAERSSDATLQISKLIRGIQNETGEVISDMEESTREVVAGSQLATEAGETLFEIDSVSNQLVELIRSSSNYALQQTEFANKIADAMLEISDSTEQSAQQSSHSNQAIGQLAGLVQELVESVGQFKLSKADGQKSAPIAAVVKPIQEAGKAKPTGAKFQPANEGVTAESTKAKPVQTPAKLPPRERQQTVMQQAPAGAENKQQTSAANTASENVTTPGNKKPQMSNEELLRKVREAKARTEARKASKAKNEGAEQVQAGPPEQPKQAAATLVTGGESGGKPGVIDEELLKKAKEMLKEVNKDRADAKPELGSSKTPVTQTMSMDDM